MANDTKIPVWPGPCVMAPMATDVLLIGQPDYNSATVWSSVKNSYYNLWMQQTPTQPAPFGTKGCPNVGAHLMWTLPYAMRSGAQGSDPGDGVSFKLTPNRWLITRFTYAAGNTVQAPVVNAMILKSDELYNLGNTPDQYNQYPYPDDPSYPVRGIGTNVVLENWDGAKSNQAAFLMATGPGDVAWSAGYDNIKNVFGLYDPLDDTSATYTYSIIGWYENPADDMLSQLPTADNAAWLAAIEQNFGWSPGQGTAAVQQAVDAWLAWQQAHGLVGVFDPSTLQLPQQAKDAIIAWYNWQQANGVTQAQAPLPINSITHSMIATVAWKGTKVAYGSGVPGGGTVYPAVAMGQNSVEAISAFMANTVVAGSGQPAADIPVIERVLEAFQSDLLFDLDKDPVKVEMQLHAQRFSSRRAGQEWVVIRPESSGDNLTDTAGQQTIPMDTPSTESLTALNTLQSTANELAQQIASLRNELFLLGLKKQYLNRHTPAPVTTAVNNSITAISTQLTAVLAQQTNYDVQITAAVAALQQMLGTGFIVKAADLNPAAAPNDPVVMVAGSKMDTKLLPPDTENRHLFVRFTGQTVTGIQLSYTLSGVSKTLVIGAEELLANVHLPAWNAIPKEVMDLWVELLVLDISNAGLIAQLYFTKRNDPYTPADVTALTSQVVTQQTVIWNDPADLGCTLQDLAAVGGIQGVLPGRTGVAFRKGQPWTPVFMDWKVIWYPNSMDETAQLNNWELGEIDYEWNGSSIPSTPNKLIFQGRTTLNAQVAQNIQGKFAAYQRNANYDNLPEYIRRDLQLIASNIGNYDMLTQSMSGFTQQLATQLISMSLYPQDPAINSLLGNDSGGYQPIAGSQTQTTALPFFPIRSGHFQVIDLWVVDSFGQILRGKDPSLGAESPIPNIFWSESLLTSSPNYTGNTATYGQLAPRLAQPAQANLTLLQHNDDAIASNSSDETSAVCGWVMANHLDNSLIVFDAAGINQGEIIKVQREKDSGDDVSQAYTIRWDAVPGSETLLGAPPSLENEHLQAFVTNLLKTSFDGADAFDSFMQAIDSTLWTMTNFTAQSGNLSVLLGRPLAVVRGEVSLSASGYPLYNQSWINTGQYYNQGGQFNPTNPPFMNTAFTVRIGDSQLINNGLIGYFEADQYDTFYAVYGAEGQTAATASLLARNRSQVLQPSALITSMTSGSYSSSYVQINHLVALPPAGSTVKLTMVVDPSGSVPLIPGSLPGSSVALPPGPVSTALSNLKASFRAGPLLLNPDAIKMPTPAEVKGKWSWMARETVTTWTEETTIQPYTPVATLNEAPLTLTEGWIILSDAFSTDKTK